MIVILKRPLVDIIISILLSVALISIAMGKIDSSIRLILGLPFLLFIPGYLLNFALFPLRKDKKDINNFERFAISIALSLAIVPIIGLVLNLTEEGLKLDNILISILLFNIVIGLMALVRWYRTPHTKKIDTILEISFPVINYNLDTLLTIIIVVSLITAPASFIYFSISPKIENQFTEFYILGSDGTSEGFNKNLAIGENTSLIIGIANHEHKTIDYSIEVWLIDQSVEFNETTFEDVTIYNHMWFKDKINIKLDHTPADIEKPWQPQWEYNYSFNIMKKGEFKLLFLLFIGETDTYSYEQDYRDIVQQKINASYRATNIWIDVTNLPKIFDFSTTPLSLQGAYINISCRVFDIDGINEIYIRLRDPENNISYIYFSNKNGNLYYINRTYFIPGEYTFYIIANDTTDNYSRIYGEFYIADIPQISDLWSIPDQASKGQYINISCLIYDNDGLNDLFLNLTSPDGIYQNFSIINNNTGYLYFSNKRYFSSGTYRYQIWVNDTLGNTNISKINTFKIV